MRLIPIKEYRDFWDVPRIFLVSKDGSLFLFDCKFDEKHEDYQDKYQIFAMPNLTEEEISGSWSLLSEKAIKYLGEISVNAVKFDETHRQFIDASALPNWRPVG